MPDGYVLLLFPLFNCRDGNKEGFRVNSAVRVRITSRKHTDDVAFVVDRGTRVTSHRTKGSSHRILGVLCNHVAIGVGTLHSDSVRLFNDGSFTIAGGGAILIDGKAIIEGDGYKVVDFDREARIEVDVGDVVVVL